jgi:hypothetical protein
MDTLTDLINSPAGLAIKGALVAAFLDFAFGVFAAVRDGTFALDAVAAFVRKHLLGRVFPASLLAIAAYYTQDTAMQLAAGAALAAYAAETLASIYDSVRPDNSIAVAEANPVPQD